MARLRFYADRYLDVSAEVKDVFQHAFNQGQFELSGIVHVAEAKDRSVMVLVDGVGFDVERTWEPLRKIRDAAPQFVESELKKLRLTRAVKERIQSEYGTSL